MHIFVAYGDSLETWNRNVMPSGVLWLGRCIGFITIMAKKETSSYHPITTTLERRLWYLGQFVHILVTEKWIRDRRRRWMINCYLGMLEQKWSRWEAVVSISHSSSRVHYLFIWIDELMSHGLRYRRNLVIVDKEHIEPGWRKQCHGVDKKKSRRRHLRYYPGHLLVEFEIVHGLGAENLVESGGFKAVIDQTSCFSHTIVINITPLRVHWFTQSWNFE